MLIVVIAGFVRRVGGDGGQEGAGAFEFTVDVARGHEAEVADLDEAFGQDVLEEAAYEFCWWQRCGLVAACAKDDCVIIRGDQPAVADGDAMGVAA